MKKFPTFYRTHSLVPCAEGPASCPVLHQMDRAHYLHLISLATSLILFSLLCLILQWGLSWVSLSRYVQFNDVSSNPSPFLFSPCCINVLPILKSLIDHTSNILGTVDPSVRAVEGVGLRLLACWGCGLDSRRWHGCLLWVLCFGR
jgi:hypothetical protein